MLPFTRQDFLEVFATYNAVAWPAAVAAYPLALATILLAWRGTARAGRMVAASLALMWGWVGIVYHDAYFASINPAAHFFAAAFVVQAALFAWRAWRGRALAFRQRSTLRTATGGAMMLYAMIAYPLIGLAAGESYPAIPLFGVTPCTLLIFTFGLMVWATRARWWLWIVPLGWAVIGGSAAVLLSIPQDWALPLSALASMFVWWRDPPGDHFEERAAPFAEN